MLKQRILLSINGCKIVEMKPRIPLSAELKMSYAPQPELILHLRSIIKNIEE